MGGRWDAWAPNAFLEQSGPAEPADILTASYCPIQVSAGFYPGQFLPHDQTDRLQHANAAILRSMSGTAAAEEIGTGVAQLRAWLAEVDPALLYEAPSPGEWTVMELLAHTVEFLHYWPPVMVGIAAEPGLPFGRGL